jgi:hypothetical protein
MGRGTKGGTERREFRVYRQETTEDDDDDDDEDD